MRILIASIGRLKDDAESILFERYQKRFAAAGRPLALGPLEVSELPESRAATGDLRKADEAARLLKACAASGARVVLDERGRTISSAAFAGFLRERRDGGVRDLAFLIGGPDGHGEAVMAGAALRLSLGAMTLPHGLARVILAEQIYRAATILSGHPYHRA